MTISGPTSFRGEKQEEEGVGGAKQEEENRGKKPDKDEDAELRTARR